MRRWRCDFSGIREETGLLSIHSRPAQFSAWRKPLLPQSTRLCDAGM